MTLAVLDGGTFYHHATIHGPRYRELFDRVIYMRELVPADLDDVGLLLVPDRINPDLLRAQSDIFTGFLARGLTLVVLGENQVETWLPGIAWSPRPTNFWWWLEKDAVPEQRLVAPDHELFAAVPFNDTVWHYHGVLTPPAGARTLIDVPPDAQGSDQGGALLYDDRTSFPGRAIVATLDPFYHHGSNFMPATTRFLDGFLPWARQVATEARPHA